MRLHAQIKNDINGNPTYIIKTDTRRYKGQICYSVSDKEGFLSSKCSDVLTEHGKDPRDYKMIALGDRKFVVSCYLISLEG